MFRKHRIAGSVVAVLAVLGPLFVATAMPASASDVYVCNSDRSHDPENQRLIHLAHLGVEIVTINLCVGRSGSSRGAWGLMSWSGDNVTLPSFNSVKLTIRLERADRIERTHTCDLTSVMNHNISSGFIGAQKCSTSWFSNAPRYKWTSDGVLTYDVKGDGKGTYTWNLRGSPEVY